MQKEKTVPLFSTFRFKINSHEENLALFCERRRRRGHLWTYVRLQKIIDSKRSTKLIIFDRIFQNKSVFRVTAFLLSTTEQHLGNFQHHLLIRQWLINYTYVCSTSIRSIPKMSIFFFNLVHFLENEPAILKKLPFSRPYPTNYRLSAREPNRCELPANCRQTLQ